MNVLVIGGAGYIGSVLVPHLLGVGHEVTVVDNLMYRQSSLLDVCHHPGFDFIRGDIRDEALMRTEIAKHDVIVPLAAIVGAPACDRDPVGAKSIMVDGLKALMQHVSTSQMVLYPNTNSGYGVGEADAYCDEASPLHPVSLYGRLKVQAEAYLLDAGNAVTFRLATVFGASPRMRMDLLVNDFVHRAVTDRVIVLFEAGFRRNYIHIRDVARVFAFGIEHYEAMKGEAYNVGLSSANLSKRQLCEVIREQVPELVVIESEIGQDPDKRDYIVSNEKVESKGFHPEVTLQEGIAELRKVYRIVTAKPFGNV